MPVTPPPAAGRTVLLFGFYCPDQTAASRPIALERGLRDAGFEVRACVCNLIFYRFWKSQVVKLLAISLIAPLRWLVLAAKYLFAAPAHDLILVQSPSHMDAWLAVILGRLYGKPVAADVFYGLYDTLVRDRRILREDGPAARLVLAYEGWLLRHLDLILIDTGEHAAMLAADYGLPPGRIATVPVGIDEALWQPCPPAPDAGVFRVLFWCSFIPLHGAETVARAAARLAALAPQVRIRIIGNGQEAPAFRALLDELRPANLEWRDRFVPLEELQAEARQAHACLGVFGRGGKAERVLPFKAYQALASARPLVTARTPAVVRLLRDREDVVLVPAGDADALADALAWLAADPVRAAEIGRQGRRTYDEKLSAAVIRDRMRQAIGMLP